MFQRRWHAAGGRCPGPRSVGELNPRACKASWPKRLATYCASKPPSLRCSFARSFDKMCPFGEIWVLNPQTLRIRTVNQDPEAADVSKEARNVKPFRGRGPVCLLCHRASCVGPLHTRAVWPKVLGYRLSGVFVTVFCVHRLGVEVIYRKNGTEDSCRASWLRVGRDAPNSSNESMQDVGPLHSATRTRQAAQPAVTVHVSCLSQAHAHYSEHRYASNLVTALGILLLHSFFGLFRVMVCSLWAAG